MTTRLSLLLATLMFAQGHCFAADAPKTPDLSVAADNCEMKLFRGSKICGPLTFACEGQELVSVPADDCLSADKDGVIRYDH